MCQNSTPSCPSLLLRLRGYDVDLQAVQTNDEDEAAVAENDGDIHATYDLISNFWNAIVLRILDAIALPGREITSTSDFVCDSKAMDSRAEILSQEGSPNNITAHGRINRILRPIRSVISRRSRRRGLHTSVRKETKGGYEIMRVFGKKRWVGGEEEKGYDVDSLEQTDTEDDTTRADVDGLRIRALPKILTKPVEQLSPAQRQTVKDIGLGRLLDLQITNLSRQMGLWLVENFDPRSCTLQLQNGQTIHITVDDVAAVLGLPKGHIEITKRTTKALPEILKEWRWIFEKTIAYITPKALTRKMIEVDAADPWFKRHFALLVMSALIDPMVNGENAPPEEGNPSILVSDVPQPPQPPQPQKEDNPMPEGLHVNTYLQTHSWFKKMFESARQLLGFKAQEDQQLTFSHQEDAFWGDPEFLNTVDEIVRAMQKRTYLNDVPSFSLGLTQEEQTRRWDDVSVVAREYNECPRILLLKPNTEIPTTIIDAWVAILNNNEEDRLSARLFASIWTTLYTVVNPLGDEDERYKKFIDSYLVDKSFAMETRWQNIQHQAFLFKFLSGLKSTYKANKIEKLKVKMMKMAWRDNRKKIDCDVFLMRHIETFRG
nr:uncharacterized protein LOC109191529 [Ipomoea batatas]